MVTLTGSGLASATEARRVGPGAIRCDDLFGTVLAGPHPPLRLGVLCWYLRGLHRSNRQIAQERDGRASDVHAMTEPLRHGVVGKRPPKTLQGEAQSDEVSVVAGHKGPPPEVKTRGGPGGGDCKAPALAALWRRRSRPFSA